MQELLNSIENFDHYYMMSDSEKVYDKWSRIEYKLKKEIEALSIEELKELYDMMSTKAREIFTWKFIHEKLEKARIFQKPESSRIKNLRKVMRTAWSFLRKGICTSIGEALKMAWAKIKLSTALKNGIAYFSFRKANGNIRHAIGTLHADNFYYERKTPESEFSISDLIKYWDVEKRAFRSFRIENLLSIE